jgi:hypothetical protein
MQTIYISPSDFAFLYTESKWGFYQKYRQGIKRPPFSMPKIFNVIDSLIKKNYENVDISTNMGIRGEIACYLYFQNEIPSFIDQYLQKPNKNYDMQDFPKLNQHTEIKTHHLYSNVSDVAFSRAMPVVSPLLHEVAALADRSGAPYTRHIRAGVALLARMVLAKDSPFHTHTHAHTQRTHPWSMMTVRPIPRSSTSANALRSSATCSTVMSPSTSRARVRKTSAWCARRSKLSRLSSSACPLLCKAL